jgi:hypothetical protein
MYPKTPPDSLETVYCHRFPRKKVLCHGVSSAKCRRPAGLLTASFLFAHNHDKETVEWQAGRTERYTPLPFQIIERRVLSKMLAAQRKRC